MINLQPEIPNILDPNCGSRRVLKLIADRWAILAIYALREDTRRFSELERAMDGISQKMLAQTLRKLESSGIVHRKAYAVVPPVVEYKLTPLGLSLLGVLTHLCDWLKKI